LSGQIVAYSKLSPGQSTDANPVRSNRYKASYQIFILLLNQLNQILGNPLAF
jgi:hypothetical protein